MKSPKRTIAVIAIAISMCGCVSYSHRRQADGVELTKFNSVLYTGKANKVRTSTKDSNYSRTVSIGSIEAQGGAEMIRSIYEAGKEAGKAAK